MKLTLIFATIVAVSSAAAIVPDELLDKRQCSLNGFSCTSNSQCCSNNCLNVVCNNSSTGACQPKEQTNCIKK
ncbi:hypothetical protein LX32DRAFT_644409 [Colletotrichum zoysiae]|uniref:Uncharacterized protein n=1 Tax=Colletotrichum zoysiae TaxID=1216348 RepID=A0AAD9LZF8_9PEZI|nr:hypothetical protein LX32DRAFT_644409 [Colletotrichum zoysiae]